MNIKNFERYYNYIFFIALGTISTTLFFVANSLSIHYKEALIFFDTDGGLLHTLTNYAVSLLGQNDIALKTPFIIFYILSNLLMFYISNKLLYNSFDKLLTQLLFMVLPGIISAAIIVNSAIIVIFCTLLYIAFYIKYNRHCYILLFVYLFIDNSFAILYLAIFFHALYKKESAFLIGVSLVLFSISMYMYGFDVSGKPKGHFIDTFGVYASIFSPIIFLYFLYTLYRYGIKKEKDLIWFISTTALFVSLLFSFRQKIYIEDFAPFSVIAIIYMIKLMMTSIRVRLPMFRKKHYLLVKVSLFILFVNVSLILFNKPLYLFIEKSEKHFAYDYHFAKEMARILKENNIDNIYSNDYKLINRLKFYGIKEGREHFISKKEFSAFDKVFPIKIYNKEIVKLYVK